MKSSVLVETTLDTVPESDRIDAWRDACSEALLGDLVWPTRPGANLRGTLRRRWIDDLLFVEWESNGFGARYWPNSPANDYIGFGVYPVDYEERLTMRDERKLTARWLGNVPDVNDADPAGAAIDAIVGPGASP